MADWTDASTNEGWNPLDDDSWQAFADGDFDEVVDPASLEPFEDGEWRKRNPLHHIADMLYHRYGEVSGRSSPAEFWWGWLVIVVVAIVLGAIARSEGVLRIVFLGWILLGAIAALTAAVRRFHDTGRSGARLLLWILPFGGIYVLYVLCGGGDLHRNGYGDPRVRHVGPVGRKLYRR